MLRLNKTTNGLVLSSYIDNTYRQIANWPGVFALTNPLAIRASPSPGGDPATPDISNRGPQIFMTNQVPAVQFPLGIDSLDHGIFLEFSTNLVDWQTLPRLRIHGEAGKMFRTNLPSAGHNRMFSRVVVEP